MNIKPKNIASLGALALASLSGAQTSQSPGSPVIVLGSPIDATMLYLFGGVILLAIVALVVVLRSRKRRGQVVASSMKK